MRSLLPTRPVPRPKAGAGGRQEVLGGGHFHLLVDPGAPTEGFCLPFPWGAPAGPTQLTPTSGGLGLVARRGIRSFEHFSREAERAAEPCQPRVLCLEPQHPGRCPGSLRGARLTWALTMDTASLSRPLLGTSSSEPNPGKQPGS